MMPSIYRKGGFSIYKMFRMAIPSLNTEPQRFSMFLQTYSKVFLSTLAAAEVIYVYSSGMVLQGSCYTIYFKRPHEM